MLRSTRCGSAKNLDVMGFEPMTSGLEPIPLTTRSTGSLFEKWSRSGVVYLNSFKMLGAIRPKIAIFKGRKWVCYGAKIFKSTTCLANDGKHSLILSRKICKSTYDVQKLIPQNWRFLINISALLHAALELSTLSTKSPSFAKPSAPQSLPLKKYLLGLRG